MTKIISKDPSDAALVIGHPSWPAIDWIERDMLRHPNRVELPVAHRFTPGLYIREIFMPAGTFLTSEIHKYEHPYVISQGVVRVFTDEAGVVELRAPHTGITTPGTRRVLYIVEDTIWTTFHVNPTNETDPDKIVAMVTIPHEAYQPGEDIPNCSPYILKEINELMEAR